MKVLVVLALVVFTGCSANLSSAGKKKPKLEVMSDFLWTHAITNAMAANEIYLKFRSTEFGKAVMEPLDKGASAALKILDTVMQRLPPTTKEIMSASAVASYNLATLVTQYIKNQLEPIAENAAPVMEEALGELFPSSQLVQDLVSPYISEIMEIVDPIFQDFQARLDALNKSFVKTE